MDLVILGGHGDGTVASQVISDLSKLGKDINLLGFLNDHVEVGELICGVPVLGKTTEWAALPENVYFHYSLLSVGKMKERSELIKSFNIPDSRTVSLIHPTAMISDTTEIARGVLVCAYAVFQPGTKVGRCCSIRAGANIGHDVTIGDYSYVGPNSTLCGYSKLESGSYIAPNAVLRDKTTSGCFSVLGAGSVAYKNLPENTTWLGNPARRIK